MIIVFEGLILSFWLLLICVVGIAKDGPVNGWEHLSGFRYWQR